MAHAPSVPDLETRHCQATPWSSLGVLDGPERFHFLVITDRTGGHSTGVFQEALEKIDLMQSLLVMSVRDYIEGYRFDQEGGLIADRFRPYMDQELQDEWDEFERMIDSLDAPFFDTPRNHDYETGLPGIHTSYLVTEWWERFGRSFYHFVYKDVLFLVINTELFDQTGALWTVSAPFAALRRRR